MSKQVSLAELQAARSAALDSIQTVFAGSVDVKTAWACVEPGDPMDDFAKDAADTLGRMADAHADSLAAIPQRVLDHIAVANARADNLTGTNVGEHRYVTAHEAAVGWPGK